MRRALVALAVSLIALTAYGGDEALLVGSWKLIEWRQARVSDGSEKVFGAGEISGRLFYDSSGNMAVQYVFHNRQRFAGTSIQDGTTEEIKQAFMSFGAYFGKYVLDAEKRQVTHLVEANLFPNSSGSTQVRTYEIEGNKLILKTPALALRSKDATK